MDTDQPYHGTYEGLTRLVQRLRGPDGCPWDREQTRESLKDMILEECYELVEAIEVGAIDGLVEELGDVLFLIVFQIRIATETDEFAQERVYEFLIQKLVRRHPHVFGDATVVDSKEVLANWDELKRRERDANSSVLDGVPKTAPALAYAQQVQKRAARAGFDWDDYRGVVAKVSEEVQEIESTESDAEREAEFGDLFFSLVNAARWLDIDAERALRHANAKFHSRFTAMEALSRQRGASFPDLSVEEKGALWEEAKLTGG